MSNLWTRKKKRSVIKIRSKIESLLWHTRTKWTLYIKLYIGGDSRYSSILIRWRCDCGSTTTCHYARDAAGAATKKHYLIIAYFIYSIPYILLLTLLKASRSTRLRRRRRSSRSRHCAASTSGRVSQRLLVNAFISRVEKMRIRAAKKGEYTLVYILCTSKFT